MSMKLQTSNMLKIFVCFEFLLKFYGQKWHILILHLDVMTTIQKTDALQK